MKVLLTDVNYKLFRSFLPFLLNSALLFLIIVKMIVECKKDQYSIENKKKKQTGYGVRATKMEDENAFTPTLCFAQVSSYRCSKHTRSDSE